MDEAVMIDAMGEETMGSLGRGGTTAVGRVGRCEARGDV